ncbi:hypothetical protein WR25_10854 [Diploscapter pachys]|uniref:Transthyretin/hydroxyisourate hydrolase domain-containing protein n=1 Tax=Diploscapter pachys TaxID=2018661 RepID=A0A2A2LBL1_9BILA|nr:hypothetical protein WR25_10854 [Diploscapter pachys]
MELSFLTTIILFLSHVSYGICLIAFRQQWVGVKGKLACNNKPLEGAVVRLWDKNLVGPDILLGETKSDINGVYEAIGGLQSVFPLNVHLRISHECDDRMIPCMRTVDLNVPSKYVSRGPELETWLDAGQMNMAFRYPDEARVCN